MNDLSSILAKYRFRRYAADEIPETSGPGVCLIGRITGPGTEPGFTPFEPIEIIEAENIAQIARSAITSRQQTHGALLAMVAVLPLKRERSQAAAELRDAHNNRT